MSTDFHTTLATNTDLKTAEINSRFSSLDAAIDTQAAAAVTVYAAYLYDSKSTGTAGGTASATTWHTRTLNTEVDPNSIVSLSANQFTPISGTYLVQAAAPGYFVNDHRVRIYNVTQAAAVYIGINTSDTSSTMGSATLATIITANGTDAYRLDHYTRTARATDGLGQAVSDGAAEVYAQVLLIKIA